MVRRRSAKIHNVVTILGCRPQFIKSSLICEELKRRGLKNIIIHTGQHYDKNMSDVFFKELNIPNAEINLEIHEQDQCTQIGRMTDMIGEKIAQLKPRCVIVYGDTNSTLSGTIAAMRCGVKVIHIEAGLRSWDIDMPEEQNRVLVDSVADVLCCPTKDAYETAKIYSRGDAYITGDVMYDMILKYAPMCKKINRTYMYATIHRQSNTDDEKNLKSIFKAFEKLKYDVILPMHPRLKNAIHNYNILVPMNVYTTTPLDYINNLTMMKSAQRIITDSGGIQKEAYMLGIPCVTLRNNTEWVETIDCGMNELVGSSMTKIIESVNRKVKICKSPYYGNGKAHKKIVDIVERTCK